MLAEQRGVKLKIYTYLYLLQHCCWCYLKNKPALGMLH
jgi:hypothetical protein